MQLPGKFARQLGKASVTEQVTKNMELARLKHSRVKGHHVFLSISRAGDTFTCCREPGNPHSPDAIIVKLIDGSTVGHVPDRLLRVLAPMLDSGDIAQMSGTIIGVPRPAPEGVWVPGSGIEIPCENVLYGLKKNRSYVQQHLRDVQKKLPRTED